MFNVTSKPMPIGRYRARIQHIDHIGSNQLVNVEFTFHDENDKQFSAAAYLDDLFPSAELDSSLGYPKPDLVVPVEVLYDDASGKSFRTEYEIDFSNDKPKITYKGIKRSQ
jgi:hypothetical protein